MVDTPNEKITSSGLKSFDPRARLVSILGEQLIRDETVGILELVKNAYDADASLVQVRIVGTSGLEKTQVVVLDNGCGMSLETILGRWFEPATGAKEAEKKGGLRTEKFKRIPLGEKGVGRFAAHRLGRKLLLISREKDARTEVAVEVNWDDFDGTSKYLREVNMSWVQREPVYFAGDKHGTYLLMTGARSLWTEPEIRKLSSSLRRLMSPFNTPRDFKVTLDVPDFPKYEELDPGDLLTRAHADFYAAVDSDGSADYEYKFRVPGYKARSSSEHLDLRTVALDWGDPARRPRCGPFFVRFHLWHRTKGLLNLTHTSRPDLDAAAGVSIYRDGLRILPYGEIDDDWLSLDEDRYLSPTTAIGRKSIVGSVEIDQQTNPELRDKTNREGLIENSAFKDLYALMKGLIRIAQNEWAVDRDTIEERRKADRKKTPGQALKELEETTDRALELSDEPLALAEAFIKSVEAGQPDGALVGRLAASLKGLSQNLPMLKDSAEKSTEVLDAAAQDLEHERDLLLGLAGMGLAAERFTHEFARLTREAHQILLRLQPKISDSSAKDDLSALSAIVDALRNDIRTLGPMFYVRRNTKEKVLSVLAAVENARTLNASQIRDGNINLSVECPEDFSIVMREGPLTQVFDNLISNACYWLGRKSDSNDRRLRIKIDAKVRQVLISDNGPGVFPRFRERIFEPFFTMKSDGRGLGLYIVKEILAEQGGTIELLVPGEHDAMFENGASFLVELPERPINA